MNEENTKILFSKHPEIFINASITGPYHFHGFECGDGWFDIIDQLCGHIDSYVGWNAQKRQSLIVFKKLRAEGKESEIPNWARGEYKLDNIPDEIPYPIARQVKEKFGGLRFYVDPYNNVMGEVIAFAEGMSMRICEECGKPGKSGGIGWVKVMCPEHLAIRVVKDAEREAERVIHK